MLCLQIHKSVTRIGETVSSAVITIIILNPVSDGERAQRPLFNKSDDCSQTHVCIDLKLLDFSKKSKVKNLVII